MTKEISSMTMSELIAESALTPEQIQDMEPDDIPEIGKYGRMAMEYLKTTDPGRLNQLILSGQHREIFMEVDQSANSLMDGIESQLRLQNPRPQNGNYLELAQYENRIRGVAEEIVLSEIVYRKR